MGGVAGRWFKNLASTPLEASGRGQGRPPLLCPKPQCLKLVALTSSEGRCWGTHGLDHSLHPQLDGAGGGGGEGEGA